LPLTRRRVARAALIVVAIALSVVGCRTVAPPDPARVAALAPRLGDLLLVGFNGTSGDGNADLERLLCEVRVGGVLLFGRNVVDPDQVPQLTHWIAARAQACAGRPVLIAVDAEGGRVMRLSTATGYPGTPSHQELGETNDVATTEREARQIAAMLRVAGIGWDLAPVVDVGLNPANTVIVGTGRSFGADAARVTVHARAFVDGMHAEHELTALKHFPGHGSSLADSHLGFVDVTDTANPGVELAPYRTLLAERRVDAVMTAHVFNRARDPRYPATLSRATITGLLREELGWQGVVVSDDLRMGAIEQHYGFADAIVLAVEAGVDVLLIADDRLPDGRSASVVAVEALGRALESGRLSARQVETALARVDALRARQRLGP
jgi:beta-N-acetylhexosaminidase